jgi:hypothetical protein
MSNDELRNEVLGLEPYPEDLKDRIREKILHTKERPLKPWERLLTAFFSVALVMILLGAIWYMIRLDAISRAPIYILVGVGFSLLAGVYTLVSLLISLKRGTERQRDESIIVYGVAGLVLYMVVAAMFTDKGVEGSDLAVLTIVGVGLIYTRINSAELRLREQVLRNELALAELSELVADRTAVDLKQD